MKKKIPLYSLILLIIAAIDSIRNLPSSALFGSQLIFFFVLSALIFLIPTSLVAAELSATFPEKGGVYYWVSHAFGKKWAMFAIWLQWINTMVWYPTILSFIAGTAAYLINPKLADHSPYLVCSMLAIFWTITVINLKGLHLSTKINNACATLGTIIPLFLLIALGGIWVVKNPEALCISFTSSDLIPSLSQSTSWISLIAIMSSFLGMELAGVHVNEIDNPQRNFPKAIFISSLFILLTMVLGSLAIAVVVPEKEINLVSGVMQVFTIFFNKFGLGFLVPWMTIAIVLGTIGGITNWLISPAKGLLHAAEFGFLPPFFAKKNKYDVPSNILLVQAGLVTVFSLLFLLQKVNAFYWFLTALSTELYMVMYILMFFSALHLHHTYKDRPIAFKIPGKKIGIWLTCSLGLIGCTTTIIVSFVPPSGVIAIESPLRYILMICAGNALTILPVFLFYRYKQKRT